MFNNVLIYFFTFYSIIIIKVLNKSLSFISFMLNSSLIIKFLLFSFKLLNSFKLLYLLTENVSLILFHFSFNVIF